MALLGPGREAAGRAMVGARVLRLLADDVRPVARGVAATAGVDWSSAAAVAFRRQVVLRAEAAQELADRLDRAADALEQHGRVVADRVALLDQVV